MKNKVTTIYKQAERFAAITNKAIISGNISRAKRLLDKAENLFEKGNNETRNVISSIYVHSVSSIMELKRCSISTLFPKSLKAEYLKQINTSGV